MAPFVRVERILPATPDAARQARRAIVPLAQHVPQINFDDLRLLVTELVTNSLRHARLGEGDSIGLVVQVDLGIVRVEVRDPGEGFEPPAIRESRHDEDGWGLYLLGRIAQRWGVDNAPNTCVWFEIDIEDRSGAGEIS